MKNNSNNNAKQRGQGKAPGGITGKGFRPGVSGNPMGRPRTRGLLNALKAAVADNTPDGRTVEQALADVLIDEALRGKHRLAAVTAIFDRLEGKPRQSIDLKQEGDFSKRSNEDLTFYVEHGMWPEEAEKFGSWNELAENSGQCA